MWECFPAARGGVTIRAAARLFAFVTELSGAISILLWTELAFFLAVVGILLLQGVSFLELGFKGEKLAGEIFDSGLLSGRVLKEVVLIDESIVATGEASDDLGDEQ